MSENNSVIETQHPLPLSDGSEILSSTRTGNKKGVSRRDFLKLSGTVLASLLLSGCLPDQPYPESESASSTSTATSPTDSAELPQPTEGFLRPELVHNVEVFGLNDQITSEAQIIRLYGFLDEKFARENNITIGNKVEQRKELLNPNERYLEVVVRQSAYDSFSRRQQETSVDFVEWIQMHVDAMNRCFENAKPPANMKSVLRRIVVISDDMPKGFWGESAYRAGKANALDLEWAMKFKDRYPLDTDCSWAIADDYRVDTNTNLGQGYFWKIDNKEGKTIFGFPPGAKNFDKVYEFPEKDDSLRGKNGVWLDFGLIHEWSHYLNNTPDESRQNFHQNPNATFDQFIFDTNNFQEPYLSAYRSYLINRNVRDRLRDVWGADSRMCSFFEGQPRSLISIEGVENPQIELRKNRFENGDLYGKKVFPNNPDQKGQNGLIISGDLFSNDYGYPPTVWSCKVNCPTGVYEVFIPAAAFAMSQISGRTEATYNIQITGLANNKEKTQIVKLVDSFDVDNYLREREGTGDQPYAKMKVDGTNTWFVWFLRD